MAERKINGRTFKVGDMLATDALILQARLARFLGPAVDKLPVIFAGRGEKANDEARAASDAAAVRALSDIFMASKPEDVAALVSDICEEAMVAYDGSNFADVVFDQEFSGKNLKDVVPVTLFVLQESLGDFFSGAVASGSRAAKAAASRNTRLDA